MEINVINLGPMDNCTYLITQDTQALLIDPAWDMNFLEHTLNEKNLTLCGVLFTHGTGRLKNNETVYKHTCQK